MDTISPHLIDGGSAPLSDLVRRALRKYGEMAVSSVESETMLLFLDFANEIVEDLREHPYYDNVPEIAYYVSTEDARPIPDTLMIAGLLAKYAIQQSSAKAQRYDGEYWRKLNSAMYYLATKGSIALELQVVEK